MGRPEGSNFYLHCSPTIIWDYHRGFVKKLKAPHMSCKRMAKTITHFSELIHKTIAG